MDNECSENRPLYDKRKSCSITVNTTTFTLDIFLFLISLPTANDADYLFD